MFRIVPRRLNTFLMYGGICLFAFLAVATVVGWSIITVTLFLGDSAWPCGLIIGLLLTALAGMQLRHRSQLTQERQRFRDLEERHIEFYS